MSASKSGIRWVGDADELRATLAHELRNPLAALANASAVLAYAPEGERAVRARGIIVRQVAALARVLEDLLDPPGTREPPAADRAVRYTARAASSANTRREGESIVARKARRVLVVDDNEDSATSTALLLEAMGHETCKAADGLEAVARADSFRPDVIFMDLGLPDIDGREAAVRIRAEPWGRQIHIVALSGWASSPGDCGHMPFDMYLVKPVRPADLTAAIEAARDVPRPSAL